MEDEAQKPDQGPVKQVKHQGKPVAPDRPERHSANPKIQSYGAHEKKEGSGKANWGKQGEQEDIPLDKSDPLYDSDEEKLKAESSAQPPSAQS